MMAVQGYSPTLPDTKEHCSAVRTAVSTAAMMAPSKESMTAAR